MSAKDYEQKNSTLHLQGSEGGSMLHTQCHPTHKSNGIKNSYQANEIRKDNNCAKKIRLLGHMSSVHSMFWSAPRQNVHRQKIQRQMIHDKGFTNPIHNPNPNPKPNPNPNPDHSPSTICREPFVNVYVSSWYRSDQIPARSSHSGVSVHPLLEWGRMSNGPCLVRLGWGVHTVSDWIVSK